MKTMNHSKNPLYFFTTIAALAISLTACKDHKNSADSHTTSSNIISSTAKNSIADQWLGQWNGPEGTFLKITGGNGKYELIIQNLDGPKNYTGMSVDDGIQFERDGVMEKIHATKGNETGMKWLSDKSNCLTVHYGEGYCRD